MVEAFKINMEINDFIDRLKELVSTELPGELAHEKMYPSNRKEENFVLKTSQLFRESAVAILLYHENNVLNCVLTQRQVYDGKHSGQISFPGGKKEDFDAEILHTALRECEEEIGFRPNEDAIIGRLTEVYIPVSGFVVHPFLFYHFEKPTFILNQREVAELIDFPLLQLIDEQRIGTTTIPFEGNRSLKDVPYFSIEGKVVWGATALILSELKELVKGVKSKRGETN